MLMPSSEVPSPLAGEGCDIGFQHCEIAGEGCVELNGIHYRTIPQKVLQVGISRNLQNCFRSEWGAKLYADIRSVLETARRRAIDPLTAIRLTLSGAPLHAGT